jgi:hypothetical protein
VVSILGRAGLVQEGKVALGPPWTKQEFSFESIWLFRPPSRAMGAISAFLPYQDGPGTTAMGRFAPFAKPSANDRYLRRAVVHCVVYARREFPQGGIPALTSHTDVVRHISLVSPPGDDPIGHVE